MSEGKFFKVTHAVKAIIDDGRTVELVRGDHDGYQFDWSRPADDPASLARYSTKVSLSPETFVATIKLGIALLQQLGVDLPELRGEDEDDETSETKWSPTIEQDAIDAARYRAWRDNMLARPAVVAKELAHVLRDYEVDEAIDKLFR